MFDVESFIKQLLPINRRTPLNVAFIKVLFAPIITLLALVETTRASLLLQAKATGQVLLLQALLNKAVYGSTVGSIYILDGNYVDVDFQVIVPPGSSVNLMGQVQGVLDQHKQAGKRYAVIQSAAYGVTSVQPLAFEPGYPHLTTAQCVIALTKSGTYRVTLTQGGTVLFDDSVGFTIGTPVYLDAVGTDFSLTVGSLSASLTRTTIGTISGITYVRSGSSLQAFAHVDTGDVEVRLSGRNSTAYTDSFTTAAVFETTVNNVAYNRRRNFPTVNDGDYTLQIRVLGQTSVTSLDFSLSTANQPPVVLNPMPDQTGKVGVYFTYSIPGNTFGDPDGAIVGYLVTSLPNGLTHSPGHPIAGTPTTAGTYTVRATVTDDKGATVYDEFVLTILAADSTVDPGTPTPPIVQTGNSLIVKANSNILNPVVENNGTKWRVRNTATPTVDGGESPYYFIDGQLPVSALSADYEYLPGDEIVIYFVISTSPRPYEATWNKKGWAKIVFGTI